LTGGGAVGWCCEIRFRERADLPTRELPESEGGVEYGHLPLRGVGVGPREDGLLVGRAMDQAAAVRSGARGFGPRLAQQPLDGAVGGETLPEPDVDIHPERIAALDRDVGDDELQVVDREELTRPHLEVR